jgi:hypothetical protein
MSVFFAHSVFEFDDINISVTVLDQHLGTHRVIGETNFELTVQLRNTCVGK